MTFVFNLLRLTGPLFMLLIYDRVLPSRSEETLVALFAVLVTLVVTIGLIVNVSSTILFLVLITFDQPWAALLVGYVLSVPYNILAVVGVWRSAARYTGPGVNVDLARGASVVLMAVLSMT